MDGAGRRPDLRGEIGQGGEVVAEDRGGGGEPVPGELHPVARVPREPDDDVLGFLDGLRHLLGQLTPACASFDGRGRMGPPRW